MNNRHSISSSRSGATPRSSTNQRASIDWKAILLQIQSGDEAAFEVLYSAFAPTLRYLILRKLGSGEHEDTLQEIFLIVLTSIRNGVIRCPERMPGFVLTIARRHLIGRIKFCMRSRQRALDRIGSSLVDPSANPETQALVRDLINKRLSGLSPGDRNILTGFYLQNQSRQQICRRLHLTDTQFRLRKSIAMARISAPRNAVPRTSEQ